MDEAWDYHHDPESKQEDGAPKRGCIQKSQRSLWQQIFCTLKRYCW